MTISRPPTDAHYDPTDDYSHGAGCTRCDTDEDSGLCHGCGHWRADIWDYSHGYYCTDCRLAIQHWRAAEAEFQAIAETGEHT